MTHTGKIGRLPKALRDQLGQLLEDNLPGSEILLWLNAQTETQEILQRYFEGRSITEQNLSDWRQSGHQHWLRRQEALEATQNLFEHGEDLETLANGKSLSNRFATILAAEMTRLAIALLEPETDPEKKWQRLCEIQRELSRLRHDDDRAARTEIQRQRREHEAELWEEAQLEREQKARKEQTAAMLTEKFSLPYNARLFGGGEHGTQMADLIYRLKHDLPLDSLLTNQAPQSPASIQTTPKPWANPEESSQIQPNRGKRSNPPTPGFTTGHA
jgi:hypothetical protein